MFNYYVYIYLNPLKSGKYVFGNFSFEYEPFYVGKGRDNRMNAHLYLVDKRNKIKQNTLNKIKKENKKPIIIKLYDDITEYSALRLEKCLINKIGRRDLKLGTLANLTNGGDGISGAVFTREKRNNMISNKRGIIKYNVDGIVLETFDNITDLSIKYPNILTNHIHRACKSLGRRRMGNCFWKYSEGESVGNIIELNDEFKTVLQYDLDGKFIKQWNCANEARNCVNSNGSAILKCCRNNKKKLVLHKFKDNMWFFKNGNIATQIMPYYKNSALGDNKIVKRKIKMYDIHYNLLGIYMPKELKNMGFFTKTIYGCCNGKFKTTQGFKWKWAES